MFPRKRPLMTSRASSSSSSTLSRPYGSPRLHLALDDDPISENEDEMFSNVDGIGIRAGPAPSSPCAPPNKKARRFRIAARGLEGTFSRLAKISSAFEIHKEPARVVKDGTPPETPRHDRHVEKEHTSSIKTGRSSSIWRFQSLKLFRPKLYSRPSEEGKASSSPVQWHGGLESPHRSLAVCEEGTRGNCS